MKKVLLKCMENYDLRIYLQVETKTKAMMNKNENLWMLAPNGLSGGIFLYYTPNVS